MPIYVDSEKTIQRITFGDFVAEKPIKESWVRKAVEQIWFLVFGLSK